MSNIELNTYKVGQANFDMCGRLLSHTIHKIDNTISDGLSIRLRDYAAKRLREYGFPVYTRCVIEKTEDGGCHYTVDFVNHLHGSIGIHGILIGKGGWPTLDHGLHIGTDQHS